MKMFFAAGTLLWLGLAGMALAQDAAGPDMSLERWNRLTPEQQEAQWATVRKQWQQMPPDQKEQINEKIREKMDEAYKNAPPEQQPEIQQLMTRWNQETQGGQNNGVMSGASGR